MKDNYPELCGKEIKYRVQRGTHQFKSHNCVGVVMGCNRKIGITIVGKKNKDKMFCLNYAIHKGEMYDKVFDAAVESIQIGEVNGLELMLMRIGGLPTRGYRQVSCAFS